MASAMGFFLDFSLTCLVWFIVIYIGIRIYAKMRKIDNYKKLVVRGCWVAIVFGLIVTALNTYNRSDQLAPRATASQETTKQSADAKTNDQSNDNPAALTAGDWLAKAYAYSASGQYSESIDAFSKAIELEPRNADAYGNRAVSYSRIGNYQKAIEDFNKAIEINPNLAEAYGGRGFAYDNIGNNKQAIVDYTKAIEINPKYVDGYDHRGTAYGKDGNLKQAIKDFNEAINIDPKFARAYFNRGMAFGQVGEQDRAIEDVKTAAKLGSDTAKGFLQGQGIKW